MHTLDLETFQWIQCSKLVKGTTPSARTLGRDLAADDKNVYCLDVDSLTWTRLAIPDAPHNPPTLQGHVTIILHPVSKDEPVLILHSGTSNQDPTCTLACVWVLDLTLSVWSVHEGGPARTGHCATRVAADTALVVGGMERGGRNVGDVKVCDDVWKMRVVKEGKGDGSAGWRVEWSRVEVLLGLSGPGGEVGDAGIVGAIDASACAVSSKVSLAQLDGGVDAVDNDGVATAAEGITKLLFAADEDGSEPSTEQEKDEEQEAGPRAVVYFGGMDLTRVTNAVRVLTSL
ncbi:hypothetical protein BC830DRAFT_795234 [Chytriomyces sp. MP71]|nr:hypothetical protein BC830DRAFT_795234 [Chytriomyces sp. MP71]